MRDYVLFTLGRFDEWVNKSAEAKAKMRDECVGYFRRLESDHGYREGSQLKSGGKAIYMKNDKIMVDGPFSETKEVLNGYVKFQAASIEEAVELAKQCPALAHGEQIQVFELTEH